MENLQTGGVRQTGDRPISKMFFWSIRATVCPEACIELRVQPGEESSWQIGYEFYEVSK